METTGSRSILFLYSSLSQHVCAMFSMLASRFGVRVTVVYWDKDVTKGSKYELEDIAGVRFIPRSSISNWREVVELIQKEGPDIVYVSGWMDRLYIFSILVSRVRGSAIRVVCGFDDQWRGTPRQILGASISKLFLTRLIDYAWVAGAPQYAYARIMGFPGDRIIGNLLSAAKNFFSADVPVARRFVMVGRADPVKGHSSLIEAYSRLGPETREAWPLVLIGSAPNDLQTQAISIPNEVKFLPFLQRDELLRELSRGGVACMPSLREQWGVAIHEMAALGYPLVASRQCGAATEFLISGCNGYLVDGMSITSIEGGLRRMTELNDQKLSEFSANSRTMAMRILPAQTCYSLLSILENDFSYCGRDGQKA